MTTKTARVNLTLQDLATIELFAGMSSEELASLSSSFSAYRYPGDHQLMRLDEPADDVCFVVSGEAYATMFSPDGREVAYEVLGAGRMFGELGVIERGRRTANVITMTESVIGVLPAARFRELLRQNPTVCDRVMLRLIQLIKLLLHRVYSVTTETASARIRQELVDMARQRSSGANAATISPMPTHTQLASRLSTIRETVTRELNHLKNLGLVSPCGRGLHVPDIDRLAALVAAAEPGRGSDRQ